MAGLIYNLLLYIFSPIIFLGYLWRIFISKKSNESWRENIGGLPRLSDRGANSKLIWVHAASVGEVMASQPVLDEIKRRIPNVIILITTITQTGNAVALKSAKSADFVAFLPLDYSVFIRKALDRVRPDIFVTVESEIWPNLMAQVKRSGITTVLINGKMSDRGYSRSKQWRWLMSWALSNLDYCCLQTQMDADRYLEVGAPPESIRIYGNTKFDQEGGRLDASGIQSLRTKYQLNNDTQVFVAGSTNPGEDEPVLDAFVKMRESVGDLKLIIAPRQIERGLEIEQMAESRGFGCVRRSNGDVTRSDYDVLILDTFGELGAVYAVCDVSFVGGTLIKKGGHSLIQPILQGKPVLFGPYTFKTRDVAKVALKAGVGFEINNLDELAEKGIEILKDPALRTGIDSACRELVALNQGASVRCAELITQLLSGNPEAVSAS